MKLKKLFICKVSSEKLHEFEINYPQKGAECVRTLRIAPSPQLRAGLQTENFMEFAS